MRIISKFVDYYDKALKEGIDKEVIYLRSTVDHIVDDYRKLDLPHLRDSYRLRENFSMVVIGFCGKIYKSIVVSDKIKVTPEITKTVYHYFYNMEDLKKYCIEHKMGVNWESSKKRRFWSSFNNFHTGQDFEDFFNDLDVSKLQKYFIEYNTPSFLYYKSNGKNYIKTNPNLKEVEFFKVKDAYTCFQEIYMYISGILKTPDRPMVQISDADKIHKHGFDKWSFRKPPSS